MSNLVWNDNFNMEKYVNDEKIIVGQQDFENESILVKDGKGTIKSCPMGMDENGDIFFIYNRVKVYVSEWL